MDNTIKAKYKIEQYKL